MTNATRKCPKCGAELSDALLGGQCPRCTVRVLRAADPNADSPSPAHAGLAEPTTGDAPSTTGLRYFGDYELLGELGRGGMGVVYNARQLTLQRTVALKLIRPEQLASPKAIERFHTEAEAAANLDHPNIVAVHESGQCEGRHYFSMKLIEGASLAQRMDEFRLPIADSKSRVGQSLKSQATTRQLEIAELLAIVADAVHYAHQRGILHRDLKPGNILIDAAGEPHVTDFGLAKRVEDDSSLTLSGEVLGTPAYMAPEQAAGKVKEMTTAADTYSLGAILYELLTGRPPFVGQTPMEALHASLHEEARAPRTFNRAVAPDLETICLKCLEKEPARRYTSARALADDLRHFIRGEPVQARPISGTAKAWRWCRRKPALAGALAAVAGVFVLGLTGVLWQWSTARQRELTARENLYAADINQIQHALAADNLRQARELLQKQVPKPGEPDLRGFEWRYLWRQCQGEEAFSLPGDESRTAAVAFSPDGRTLARASNSHTVQIWDVVTKSTVATLANSDPDVYRVSFARRGDMLAIASRISVRVWDTKTYQPLRSLPGAVLEADFSPADNLLLTGTTNGLTLWDTRTWTPVSTLNLPGIGNYNPDTLDCIDFGVAFSPDGRRIAAVVDDGVELLSVPDLVESGALKETMPHFRFAAFSPDGRNLATCAAGGQRVKLWDLDSQSQSGMTSGHVGTVFCAAFSPDGGRLATGGADQTVKVWDVHTGELLRSFRGHVDLVRGVAFSPDGKLLASASADGTVRLWDPGSKGSQSSERRGFEPVGFGSGGALMGFDKGTAPKEVDVESLQEVGPFQGFRNPRGGGYEFWVFLGNLFSDGQTAGLVTRRGSAGALDLWDINRGQFLCSVAPCWGEPLCAVFSPKARILATATANHTVTLWQVPHAVQHSVLTNVDPPLALSHAQTTLAAWGVKGYTGDRIRLWKLDREAPHELAAFDAKTGFSEPLAFSPDDKVLASGGVDGRVRLWAVPSGLQVGEFVGHERDISSVCFSADGRTLATGSQDGTLRLWHVRTRRELLRFQFPGQAEVDVKARFAPDGRALAAAMNDGDSLLTAVWFAPCFAEIAIAEGKEYWSLARDPITWNAVALALEKHGRPSEAIEAFTETIHRMGGQPGLTRVRRAALKHRARLLLQEGRSSQAGEDNCQALDLPLRDPHTAAQMIDLSPFFNRSLDSEEPVIPPMGYLAGLPSGVQGLPGTGGTQFDIRGVVRLRSGDNEGIGPVAATGIQVQQECRRLHFLESAHFREPDNTLVGTYVVRYVDGNQAEVPIRYGQHVRDWVLSVDPATLSDAKVAWTGTHRSKGAIRIFEQTWENPRPTVQIQSLDFVSKLTKTAPFLIALTAEP
jgi:WD40 repeat protein